MSASGPRQRCHDPHRIPSHPVPAHPRFLSAVACAERDLLCSSICLIRNEERTPLSPAPSRPRGVDGRAVLLLTTATEQQLCRITVRATPPPRHAGLFLTRPLPQGWTTMKVPSQRASRQPVKAQEARAPMHDSTLPETRTTSLTRSRRAPSTLRSCAKYGTLHLSWLSFLSALRQSGRRAHPSHVFSSLSRSLKTSLTSSGLKSACGFVHFRSLVHASLCPPLYEPTRPVSSSRRDQTEDATLRSSRVSCVPGHPQTSANARHRPLGPDDAKARAAAHTNERGGDPHYGTE